MNAAMLERRGALGKQLPGVPESVREARALVRAALGMHHPALTDAEYAVSELATNAIQHSHSRKPGGTFAVMVQAEPGAVVILVRDAGGRGVSRLAGPAHGAEHGRGMRIIDALACDWGSDRTRGGRVTWCRIPVPRVPAPRDERRA